MSRSVTVSPSMPAGARPSTLSWARSGMTLILPDAAIIVGAIVTRRLAFTSAPMRGSVATMCSSAVAGSEGSSPSP